MMKNLKKITVRNAEDVLSSAEMKILMGGDEIDKSCKDHIPEACFGPCWEIVDNKMASGECYFNYEGSIGNCSCVLSKN